MTLKDCKIWTDKTFNISIFIVFNLFCRWVNFCYKILLIFYTRAFNQNNFKEMAQWTDKQILLGLGFKLDNIQIDSIAPLEELNRM